jgi:hypothetical protein
MNRTLSPSASSRTLLASTRNGHGLCMSAKQATRIWLASRRPLGFAVPWRIVPSRHRWFQGATSERRTAGLCGLKIPVLRMAFSTRKAAEGDRTSRISAGQEADRVPRPNVFPSYAEVAEVASSYLYNASTHLSPASLSMQFKVLLRKFLKGRNFNRKWKFDDVLALFSWIFVGNAFLILAGTTTFFSVLLWLANSLQFQGVLAHLLWQIA